MGLLLPTVNSLQVAALRGALNGLGIARGDRVALLCGNTLEFVVTYFACLGRGIVCVPLNPTAPAPELEREMRVVSARAVVIAPSAVAGWNGVDRSHLPSLAHVIATTELAGALTFRMMYTCVAFSGTSIVPRFTQL